MHPTRPLRKLLCLLSCAPLAASLGCGDDKASPDTSADVAETSDTADGGIPDLTGKSAYHATISLEGETYDLGLRDLTGLSQYFSFGSSHIAPAVSFAMTDSVTFPRTINFTLDFGIVIPSPDHAIGTEGVGSYALSDTTPSATVFVKGLQYRSVNPGSAGEIVVSEWSTETDGIVAGTFTGTLVADGPTGKTVAIEGYYHFILPEKEQGQPQ